MGGKLISRFAPISAIRTSAVLRSTPGMVSRNSTSSEKGAHSPTLSRGSTQSDGLVKVVDVSQHPADHEAMVSGGPSFQCFPQSRDLRAKAAPSQL
jgi:hypothetical protein